VPVAEFRPRDRVRKLLDEGPALLVRFAVNPDAFAFAHVNGFSSGDGVRPYHGMLDVGDVLGQISQLAAGGVFLGACAVDRAQAEKGSLCIRRQRLEGGGGTRKNRIAERTAVLDRNFKGVQQRPARRRLGVGQVGVPGPARIGIADRLAVLDGLISSSPNLRANAICCSGVSFWSRNTRTE
jgi:hypothetical protein